MDLLYPLIPKGVPLNSDVIRSAPLGNLDALKIYVKSSKNQFFAKKSIFGEFLAEYVSK